MRGPRKTRSRLARALVSACAVLVATPTVAAQAPSAAPSCARIHSALTGGASREWRVTCRDAPGAGFSEHYSIGGGYMRGRDDAATAVSGRWFCTGPGLLSIAAGGPDSPAVRREVRLSEDGTIMAYQDPDTEPCVARASALPSAPAATLPAQPPSQPPPVARPATSLRDEIRAFLTAMHGGVPAFCCDDGVTGVDDHYHGGIISVTVRGRAVTIRMRELAMMSFAEVADRNDQFAANVIYHVFENFSDVDRVTVHVRGSQLNDYGERSEVTTLELHATREQFARLRATGDFQQGPLNIAFGRAALDRVLRLFRAHRR